MKYVGLAYFNRALLNLGRGETGPAEADLTAAIARPPYRIRATAYSYRGTIRMSRGNCAGAREDFDRAIKTTKPPSMAYAAKAWVLATCADDSLRNGSEAVKAAQKALSLRDHWKFHDALAAAYAESGRYEDSVRELKLAQEKIATEESESQSRAGLQARLALYQAGQPYRQISGQLSDEAAHGREWLDAF